MRFGVLTANESYEDVFSTELQTCSFYRYIGKNEAGGFKSNSLTATYHVIINSNIKTYG
jgi:hypothetical protein